MLVQNVTISQRLTELSDRQIRQMATIVTNYFPDQQLMEETIRVHMEHADTVRLALYEDSIVGFSVASKYQLMTPFYPRPIRVIFQRMLYIDPDYLFRGIGIKLLSTTMKDLFGCLWPFKRIAAFCRTQNPIVVKFMAMYNVSYPQYQQPVPDDIRAFAESLLPLLGARSIDKEFRLIGTLSEFSGADYTDVWNRYYLRRDKNDSKYDNLILHSAFDEKDGRIINRGAFVLMIAYAKPLHFIRYLFSL